MSDKEKLLKQEIMELSIELAKMQDEIDELKKYKSLYLLYVGKFNLLLQQMQNEN